MSIKMLKPEHERFMKAIYDQDVETILPYLKEVNIFEPIEVGSKGTFTESESMILSILRHGDASVLEAVIDAGIYINIEEEWGTRGNLLTEALYSGDAKKMDLILALAKKGGVLHDLIDAPSSSGKTPAMLAFGNLAPLSLIEQGEWLYEEKSHLAALCTDIREQLLGDEFNREEIIGFIKEEIEEYEKLFDGTQSPLANHMKNLFFEDLNKSIEILNDENLAKPFMQDNDTLSRFLKRNDKNRDKEIKQLLLKGYKGELPFSYFENVKIACIYKGNRALLGKLIEHSTNLEKRDLKGYTLAEYLEQPKLAFEQLASDADGGFYAQLNGKKAMRNLDCDADKDTNAKVWEPILYNMRGEPFIKLHVIAMEYADFRQFILKKTEEYKASANSHAARLESIMQRVSLNETATVQKFDAQVTHMRRHSIENLQRDQRLRKHSLDLQSTGILIESVADLDHNRIPRILAEKMSGDFINHPCLADFWSKLSGGLDELILGAKVAHSNIVDVNTTRNLQQKAGYALSLAIKQIPLPGTEIAGMIAGYLVQGRSNNEDAFNYSMISKLCSQLPSDLVLPKNITLVALHQFQDLIIAHEFNPAQVDALVKTLKAVCLAEIVGRKYSTPPDPATLFTRIGEHLDSIKPKLMEVIKKNVKTPDGLMSGVKNYVNAKLIERKFTK